MFLPRASLLAEARDLRREVVPDLDVQLLVHAHHGRVTTSP